MVFTVELPVTCRTSTCDTKLFDGLLTFPKDAFPEIVRLLLPPKTTPSVETFLPVNTVSVAKFNALLYV